MTDIKICGLSTPETIDAAVGAGASHVGLVFFAKSPRHLDTERAAALAVRIPASVKTVGVFVDPDDDYLDHVRRKVKLDVLQLHDVGAGPAVAFQQRHGLPVWAAIGVATAADIAAAGDFLGVERLLFDAKTPKGADLPGGMGLRFDWRLLSGARKLSMRWGLAGGLDPGNVAQAIRDSGAGLVDVSSGVEERAGVKSIAKIKAFIAAARGA
jgi:phosphoribosylanthranilate isomerase